MTDAIGEFNKVAVVSKYESLSAYEQTFKQYVDNVDDMKKMKEMMKGYHDLYLTGKKEIYQILA